jgi:methyl-accepting chemotaxis protein
MRLLSSVRIGGKIAAAFIPPLVMVVILSAMVIGDKARLAGEAETVHAMVPLATDVSLLVHELQKERGSSALFLGSKGAKFGPELQAQRKTSDGRRDQLEGRAAALEGRLDPAIAGRLAEARKGLRDWLPNRARIDAMDIEPRASFGGYTQVIRALLDVVAGIAVASEDHAISRSATAYLKLLEGKERAGMERATGSGAFAAGRFEPDIYRRFVALIADQQTLLGEFLAYASPEQRDFFKATMDAEPSREVERMRKVGLDGIGGGALGDIAAPAWFAATTGRIELLKKVEDRLAADLEAQAEAIGGKARRALAVTAAVTLVAALATAMVALVLVRGITRPLAEMTAVMGRLAGGDTAAAVHATERTDEIGDIARSVQVFKETMIEAEGLRQAQEEERRKAAEHLRHEMLSLTELLEEEIDTTVTDISAQAGRLSDGATRLLETADSLKTMARTMSEAVETTSANVQTVAGATEQLEASSREISQRMQQGSALSESAFDKAEAAAASVAGLTDSTARIGDVVNLIQSIAGQTRMLALNATIEAARAGDAGKGFAVVAGEVKGLASQTEDGIGRVNTQAQEIGRTTAAAVDTVEAVAETIRDMTAIAADIAASARQQTSATAEIMASAMQAASHTGAIADNARALLGTSEVTGRTARTVSEMSGRVNSNITALQRRLTVILRDSSAGSRRSTHRIPASLRFTAEFDGTRLEGITADISVAGALLVAADVAGLEGKAGWAEFEGTGRIQAQAVLASALGLHVKFLDPQPAQEAAVLAGVDKSVAADQPFVEIAQKVAAGAGAAFVAGMRDGRITMADLFDAEYDLIDGTDPVQVMARHTEFTDAVLPALIEPPLDADRRIVFCCVTDRNGYIATHNRRYSQPQRPGEKDWNTANCRNRRVFDDRTGILAARNTKPWLAQTYPRDMGGTTVLVKEIDVPVTVDDRHWGAVRLALRLQ